MKKLKKIAASLMVAATMITSSVNCMNVSASYEDTYFSNFTAPPGISGDFSSVPIENNGVRRKDTDKSVFVNITSSTYKVGVQTWGLSNLSWSGGSNRTCNSSGNYTNCVTLIAGYRYQIKNGIYESGYGYAGLKMASADQYSCSRVTGKWSPDYYPDGAYIAS